MAAMVTNLPVLFPLFKRWLCPFLRSSLRLKSHPEGQDGWKAQKGPGEHLHGDENDSRSHQDHPMQCPIFHASHERKESGKWPSTMSGLNQTPTRTLGLDPGGSAVYSGPEDNDLEDGRFGSQIGECEHGNDGTFQRTDGGGSDDGAITSVPPCKIRKDVEVLVEEGRPALTSYGNFTSAWGPKRKSPGPDLPLEMRTPYLMDHLQPISPGTESGDSGYTTKSLG